MVYTVVIRKLSFKQNISNVEKMLEDQVSTYAILRYAMDIPQKTYKMAMSFLAASHEELSHRKLRKLVDLYARTSKVGFEMDEEFVETVEVTFGGPPGDTMDMMVDIWDSDT